MSVAEKEAATRAARFRPDVAVTALRKDNEVREVDSKPVRSTASDGSVAKVLKTAGQTQRNLSEGKSLGKQKSEGNKLTKSKVESMALSAWATTRRPGQESRSTNSSCESAAATSWTTSGYGESTDSSWECTAAANWTTSGYGEESYPSGCWNQTSPEAHQDH
jgi:hypothetical protein